MFIGEFAALGAALLWSANSILLTDVTKKIDVMQTNVDRMIIGALLLAVTMLLLGVPLKCSVMQLAYLSLSGIIGLVVGDSFLLKSFKEIGPRLSMLLMSSNPALAAILAYFFLGERLNAWGLLGIALTLGGIAWVVLEGKPGEKSKKHNVFGIFCSFMGAVGQASGLLFARLAFNEGSVDQFAATLIRLLSAIAVLFPAVILMKRYKMPVRLYLADRKTFNKIFIATFLGTYIGVTLSFVAVIYTKVGIASTLMSTMPVIMLPISYFYLKEKLSYKAVVGALVAVGGVAVLFMV